MKTMTRFFAMMIMAAVLLNAAETFAKGPRTLLQGMLTAVPGAPAAAKGKAKFDASSSRTNFSVEAQGLAALNGRSAAIFVNGKNIGSTGIALGRLKLELSTQRGQVDTSGHCWCCCRSPCCRSARAWRKHTLMTR